MSGGEPVPDVERAQQRVAAVLPEAEVVLTGGALIEGDDAGDIDLVVLVRDLPSAAEALRRAGFPPLYEEEWRDDWAAFREAGPPQVDVVLTRPGTKGDDHHRRSWELLLLDELLLEEYRRLKLDRTDYDARKAGFFDRVVSLVGQRPTPTG